MIRILLLLVFSICYVAPSADVIVKDLKIYVNCQEFFIKAFCYSPTPLGRSEPASEFEGGLCSPRKNVFGVTQSACEDEDFFDGSSGDREMDQGWFTPLWEQHLPLMKELGANTVRIYHVSPWTRQASIEQLGKGGIAFPIGKSHIEFMNAAQANGLKVIFPLPGEELLLRTKSKEEMFQLTRNVIDEVGNHSALLMWTFGNELPLDDQLIQMLNEYMDYTRSYTYQKWNRVLPVTHAVVDYPVSYDKLAKELKVDIFSSNAGYRGLTFSDLWEGSPNQNFSGWRALSKKYNKPLFISEIGWLSINNDIDYSIPTWFNQKYKDLVAHVEDGCVGVAFFEFNDEPTKVDPLQKSLGVIGFNVTYENGKSSLDKGALIADGYYRKPIIFDAVKQGEYEGKPYNFNADVFELIGRNRTALSSENCVATIAVTNDSTVKTDDPITNSQSSTVSATVSTTPSSAANTATQNTQATQTETNMDTSAASKSFYSIVVIMTIICYFI